MKVKDARRTPLVWLGGKSRMARHITPLIDNASHLAYVETHAGGAAVFFAKRYIPPVEILNDIDGRVAAFFRVLRNNPDALAERKDEAPFAKDYYREQHRIMTAPRGAYPVADVAFAVWYCFGVAFNHTPHPGNLGVDITGGIPAKWERNNAPRYLRACAARLRDAQICEREALKLIGQADGEDVLFYVDPPYYGARTANIYRRENEDNNAALLATLAGVRGKFVMSEYHSEGLREYASARGWNYRVIEMQQSIAAHSEVASKHEALVYNFTARECGGEAAPTMPLFESEDESNGKG